MLSPDKARIAKESCRSAAVCLVIALLVPHASGTFALPAGSAPLSQLTPQQWLIPQQLLHRALLSRPTPSHSSSSSSHRALQQASLGRSGAPGTAWGTAPATSSSSSSRRQRSLQQASLSLPGMPGTTWSTAPATTTTSSGSSSGTAAMAFMATDESTAPNSVASCPLAGKFVSSVSSSSSSSSASRAPVAVSGDGSALVWGSPAAPYKDAAAGGSVGAVFFLDGDAPCSYNQSSKLPNPVVLLPVNYDLAKDSTTGVPSLSQVAASGTADIVLVATASPAMYSPPKSASIQAESGAGVVPYVLAAFSYRQYLKPNASRPIYVPAGVLPIPAVAASSVVISGLSVSLDGTTAMACVMPKCSGPNPSACGSGWAHILRLSVTPGVNGESVGGHTWSLIAQLPYAGYPVPGGHGVSCSLSLDGGTAAVLATGVTVETVQVPVSNTTDNSSISSGSATTTDTSVSSSSSSTGGGGSTRQRLRQLLQRIRGGSSSGVGAARRHWRRLQQLTGSSSSGSTNTTAQFKTVTTTTRNAYLQMYAATAAGGPWAVVGTHTLDQAVADCILGPVSCRPVVDVSDRFAAVSYLSGLDLKAEVVFHNAPQAAASKIWADFVKVCTLSKLLVAIDGDTTNSNKDQIAVPGPSADQLAGIAIRQPPGTLSLRVMVATRNPGAVYLWTLSRRGEQACPTTPKNLLEALNPSYAPTPLLTVDVTADGLVTVFCGVADSNFPNRLGVLGGSP